MKRIKRYFLSIGLFILLFFTTFYFIFSKYSFQDFLKTLTTCDLTYITLAFLCIIFYLALGTIFMKQLFASFGVKISNFQSLCYNCIEIYFSAVTPSSTGGQPVEAYYMARDEIPYRKSTVVILINTILYKSVIVLLGVTGMLIFPKLIFQNGWLFTTLMLGGLILNIIVILLFSFLIYSDTLPKKIMKLGIRLLSFFHLLKPEEQQKKTEELDEVLKDYHACAEFTKNNPKIMLKSFIMIFFQRLSQFMISYFIYRAFRLSGYSFLAIIFLQVAITQATDCVPFPGGVMVGETLTYQINSLIYGVNLAFSSMLLLRGISFYFLVFLSSIFFVIYHFIGGKKKHDRNL
ncbi:MAG: flippase-like domain-containing protein [Bacilli bacterium]|jgi:hypothetical protein|nr:flippase-like domain-containing protein [Bacilli bacterium]